jgi:ribosomal protein L40E
MTEERRLPRPPAEARPSTAITRARDDQVERTLGRTVALGLPLASIAGALAVGAVASVGSSLLVLAAGALLGAIGLFWASVRTLSGDAPLPASFEGLPVDRPGVDALVEEKLRSLRALKDIENEHEIGKINDADYDALLAHYRDEAKAVMRKMDVEVAPFREEAERIATDFLKKSIRDPAAQKPITAGESESGRLICGSCGASNESDAVFCKQCGLSTKKEHPGAST